LGHPADSIQLSNIFATAQYNAHGFPPASKRHPAKPQQKFDEKAERKRNARMSAPEPQRPMDVWLRSGMRE
jgi:hypothetical protein